MRNAPLILASASPRRKDLLASIGIIPACILPADIDESPLKDEQPRVYVQRIACEKTWHIANKNTGAFVLGADTVVACGRRILPKAEDEATARKCLKLLSGRRHRVYTAIAIVNPQGKLLTKTVMTQVSFLQLNEKVIDAYIKTGEWHGKAGGYAIQGSAQAFIPSINGSYSSVVGLPLSETKLLLQSAGYTYFSSFPEFGQQAKL